MNRSNHIPLMMCGLVVAILVGSGCGRKTDEAPKAQATPPGALDSAAASQRSGPFVGTLPCADCAGIDTRLTLFFATGSATPLLYHLQETYRGTPDNERAVTKMGRFSVGSADGGSVGGAAAGARIVQLDFDKPEEVRGFRMIGDDSLRMLDRQLGEIESDLPYTLVRAASDRAPLWVEVGVGTAIQLRVEQDALVRLPANHTTGFQWALADTTRDVVAPLGTLYVQDAPGTLAVGVGGSEYWRLRAVAPGTRDLSFVYRRPWESQPPARTAHLTVTVR